LAGLFLSFSFDFSRGALPSVFIGNSIIKIKKV
jgi:hypothetical protein